MKNYFLAILMLANLLSYAQEYQVGDTLYLKKGLPDKKMTADAFNIIEEKITHEGKLMYFLCTYKWHKEKKSFLKFSKQYAIDPHIISGSIKQIFFHENGKKASEGPKKKGRNIGKWTYWYKNGKIREEKLFPEVKALKKSKKNSEVLNFWDEEGNHLVKHGNGTYLYVKDSITIKGFYKNGKKHGKFSASKKNEKRYEEYYKNGNLIKGFSWDKLGTKYSYKYVFEPPSYKRGQKGIKKHIKDNFSIPQYAIDNKIDGSTIVSFKIEKNGNLSNIKVIKSLCKPCDKEVIRVIKLMKGWKPGAQRGQKVKVTYSLPISYRL